MSSEAAATARSGLDRAVGGERNAALRLAFGVTACFAVAETLGWDATFLAPLLAANMLVKAPRPPSFTQGLIVIVLILLSTSVVLAITAALLANPTVLILALALVIYLSFYAHRRGAPELATLLLQISVVSLPVVAVLSPDGAGTFATTLLSAGCVALITVWGAHAAFPAPAAAADDVAPVASATPPEEPVVATRHALLDTLVLLPVLTWYILDATQVAVVVLIIIVTILRQHEPKNGQRAALGLIFGNLIGGIAAAIIYNLVLLNNNTLPFFIAACLAASLLFAGLIVTAGNRAPVYAIAFATFILLLGLGLTPLPGGSGEAFVSRLLNVLLASTYAVGALSLVQRWRIVGQAAKEDGSI